MIEDVRAGIQPGPGTMTLQAMPACDRPGIDCSVGLPRLGSFGGTFELLRANADVVEGRFRAPAGSRGTGEVRTVVEGHFVARLTNVVDWRLAADHPCVPR